MAKRPNISTIATGYYSREALNSNFSNIRAAFDNTLSLDGSTPNAMSGDIDMNGNSILNVGTLDADSFTISGTPINNPASILSWEGAWLTATDYVAYDVVYQNGSSYLCLIPHTSGTFSADLAAAKWGLLASAGASGSGSGDLVAANNLSDVANTATALSNLGGQPVDPVLSYLSSLTAATAKIPYFDSASSASLLTFVDEDDMASDSDTAIPSQQSVKAYVDGLPGGIGEGQTWQDMNSVRTTGVAYQNTTGKPIMVAISRDSIGVESLEISTDNVSWSTLMSSGAQGSDSARFQVIIPDGLYYRYNGGVSGASTWWELR